MQELKLIVDAYKIHEKKKDIYGFGWFNNWAHLLSVIFPAVTNTDVIVSWVQLNTNIHTQKYTHLKVFS